jgi:2,3-bisphosphoglycerate-independent phosphoglycerate mutase
MIANANDNDFVFFYATEADREGWDREVKVRGIERVEAVTLTDEEVKKMTRYGY